MPTEEGVVHFNANPESPKLVSRFVKRENDEDPTLAIIQHDLDNSYPIVQLWDNATGLTLTVPTQTVDANRIALRFPSAVVNGRFVATIMG